MDIAAFTRSDGYSGSCTSGHLTAFAWGQFDVMDDGSNWDFYEWEGIPYFWIRARTCDDRVIDFESLWSKNISLISICILYQSNFASSVWIVFKCDNFSNN